MEKEDEEVASAAGLGGGLPRPAKCGRGHRHMDDAQVAECDDRLAGRARLKAEKAARLKAEGR